MAMLRIIDSIQSPTLTKSRISGKGVKWFCERKKLKAQFPNTSENMNVLQFLGFRSDEIKHLSSMVLTYTSAQRECSHNTDYARAVKKMFSSVSVGLARKYRIGGQLGEALAVERMLRNDRGIQRILGRHRAISWGPCRIFEIF
ncbi:CIC_collapsed_G0026220.mRNA.1.CDS.1 [Saccharomyces cerevisiae]|nr:CIC_collapsed_G0026220.mRNA.1.CDS.1 [Saccharomyces cerevisiae]